MKKIVSMLLCLLFLLALCVPASASSVDFVVDLDFNVRSEIKSGTLPTGAKTTMQATDNGWLPSATSEIKTEGDGTKVLRFQRLENQLVGWDVNTLASLTGDCVVYSTTARAMLMPSKVEVPRPISSKIIRERRVAFFTI